MRSIPTGARVAGATVVYERLAEHHAHRTSRSFSSSYGCPTEAAEANGLLVSVDRASHRDRSEGGRSMTSVTSSAEYSVFGETRAQSKSPTGRHPICTRSLQSVSRRERQPQTKVRLKGKKSANGRAQVHTLHRHAGDPTHTETGTGARNSA